jgi:TonB family protein
MRPLRSYILSLAVLAVIGGLPSVAVPQSSANTDWRTVTPEGEEFSILMPKDATSEASKVPYHKMELNSRLYLSASPKGPVFAVLSLSGIKSNPAAYTEMERLNSYVDAFKNLFPSKVRGKDAVARLTLVGNKVLNGHAGREYGITVADLSGTLKVFATRKRFYAVVFLDTKKDEALQERFLSSFLLPEKVIETPAPGPPVREAVNARPSPTGEKQEEGQPPSETNAAGKPSQGQPQAPQATNEVNAEKKTEESAGANTQPGQRAPVSGGILNGKALNLPKPDYPADARNAHATGTVVVQVTVDEAGNVISAHAVSGHPLLQQVSVNAALQAKFSPTSLMGEAVKVTGVITYNFAQ